jgi:hypothetical protein
VSFDSSASRSSFWQAQAERFAALRLQAIGESKRPVDASYHPEGWNLENVRAFSQTCGRRWLLSHGTPAVIDDLKSIAAVCAVALGAPNNDLAWVEWLDCLRRQSVDFKPGELSTNSWSRDWRPEPDHEVAAKGLMFPPLEVRPDADPVLIIL